MELTDLRIFRTVVDEGGIARAARRLHRVPSNVTTRVKQLEASMGAQLFYRDRGRLHLSPSGELLLAYADRLLRLSDEARSVVGGGAPRGVLRLGALESTSASRLPAVLAAYHRACPDVRIELSTSTNDALTGAVADRRLDAAFVAERPAAPDLAYQPLFAERLVLVSSLQHRRIRRPLDTEGDTVIAFPNGCAYRRLLLRWLGDARLATVRVMELGSYHAIVACATAGTGIAVMPSSVLDAMHHVDVARHALPKALAQLTTPLIWRAGESSPALLALREQLAATIGQPR